MTTSPYQKEKRAKTADLIVGLVLLLAVVCWLVSSGSSGLLQPDARAGMNGLPDQSVQYTNTK